LAGDGLYIFDPGGKRLHRWPYAEIINAFPDGSTWDHVLAHQSRPEAKLMVGEAAFYDAIARRAPQVASRSTPIFRTVLGGMPEQALGGLVVGVLILVLMAISAIATVFH
jgi:hypothetical protein